MHNTVSHCQRKIRQLIDNFTKEARLRPELTSKYTVQLLRGLDELHMVDGDRVIRLFNEALIDPTKLQQLYEYFAIPVGMWREPREQIK